MTDFGSDAIAGLEREPAVSDEELATLLAHVEASYAAPLPDDYVAFLRVANGADGTLENGDPIVLWAAELLPEINADNETERWMPGCLMIGSDAGDLLYGIDLRADASPERYVVTEDVGIGWDYLLWQGRSFADLLAHLSGAPLNGTAGAGGRLRAALARLRPRPPEL